MRSKRTIAITLAALLLPSISSPQPKSDQFRSEVAGIEIFKPADWHFQDLELIAQHHANSKLKDAEFEAVLEDLATAPLVVVATRHPEPYDALNSTLVLQVRFLEQLAGVTGRQMLEAVIPGLKAGYADFRMVEDLTDISVDGVAGARFTAEYMMEMKDGRHFPARLTIIAVTKDSHLYQVMFSAPTEGPDAIANEVDHFLQSFKFLETDA